MHFCELKEKDVINRCNCRRLGRVNDLILDPQTPAITSSTISTCSSTFFHFFMA